MHNIASKKISLVFASLEINWMKLDLQPNYYSAYNFNMAWIEAHTTSFILATKSCGSHSVLY